MKQVYGNELSSLVLLLSLWGWQSVQEKGKHEVGRKERTLVKPDQGTSASPSPFSLLGIQE